MISALWAAIIGGFCLFVGLARKQRRADRLERRRDLRRREARRLIAHDDEWTKLELNWLHQDYLGGIYNDREFVSEMKRLGLSNRQISEFLELGEPNEIVNEVARSQTQHRHQQPQDQPFRGRAVLDRPERDRSGARHYAVGTRR